MASSENKKLTQKKLRVKPKKKNFKINPAGAYYLRKKKLKSGDAPDPSIPVYMIDPTIMIVGPNSGTAHPGDTLICDPGSASGYPRPVYSYQWKKAGVDLTGEDTATYLLKEADVASEITCECVATNSEGSSAPAVSNGITVMPAQSAPVVTVDPVLTAPSDVLGTLITTSNDGAATGSPTPVISERRWYRDAVLIVGENGATYLTTLADEGAKITTVIDWTNSQGTTASDPSNEITMETLTAPVVTVQPVLSGTGAVGTSITLADGTATGNPTPAVSARRWYRDNVLDASMADQTSHTVVEGDVGIDFSAEVTWTNSKGSTPSSRSNDITAIAAGGETYTVRPRVTGSNYLGDVISVSNGEWPTLPATYGYQWRRDGADIPGANSNVYMLVTADIDKRIECWVTTNEGGAGLSTYLNARSDFVDSDTGLPIVRTYGTGKANQYVGPDQGFDGGTSFDKYVDGSVASSGNGDSLANAYKTVDEAYFAIRGTGGTIGIKGGVYPERIDAQMQSSTPVVFKNYGQERPEITAFDDLGGWFLLTSGNATARDIELLSLAKINEGEVYKTLVSNTNWTDEVNRQNITTINCYEGGEYLYIAQDNGPDADWFYTKDANTMHNPDSYTANASGGKVDTITDTRFEGYTENALLNMRIMIWGDPGNVVYESTITGKTAADTISVTTDILPNADGIRYNLWNACGNIRAGSFAFDLTPVGTDHSVYLQPNYPSDIQVQYSAPGRQTIFDMQQYDDFEFHGLKLTGNNTVEYLFNGQAIQTARLSDLPRAGKITINNCWFRGGFGGASGNTLRIMWKTGAVLTRNQFDWQWGVSSVYFEVNESPWVADNLHMKIERAAIVFYGGTSVAPYTKRSILHQSLYNHTYECGRGSHTNKQNHYQGVDGVLEYGNKFKNSGGYMTFQRASNLFYAFNWSNASGFKADARGIVDQNHYGPPEDSVPDTNGVTAYWNNSVPPSPNNDFGSGGGIMTGYFGYDSSTTSAGYDTLSGSYQTNMTFNNISQWGGVHRRTYTNLAANNKGHVFVGDATKDYLYGEGDFYAGDNADNANPIRVWNNPSLRDYSLHVGGAAGMKGKDPAPAIAAAKVFFPSVMIDPGDGAVDIFTLDAEKEPIGAWANRNVGAEKATWTYTPPAAVAPTIAQDCSIVANNYTNGDPSLYAYANLATINGDHLAAPVFQWKLDGSPVGRNWSLFERNGASGELTLEITYSNSAGSVVSTSNALTLVGSGEAPIVLTNSTVSASDGGATDSVLTATPGTASGSPTPTRVSRWYRDDVLIGGETGSTYTMLSSDDGASITHRDYWSNATGNAESANSNATVGTGDPVVSFSPIGVYTGGGTDADNSTGATSMQKGNAISLLQTQAQTIAFGFKVKQALAGNVFGVVHMAGGNVQQTIYIQNGTAIYYRLRDNASAKGFDFVSPATLALDTEYVFMLSFDCANDLFSSYLATIDVNGGVVFGTKPAITQLPVLADFGRFSIGGNWDSTAGADMEVSLYSQDDGYTDFSNAANRLDYVNASFKQVEVAVGSKRLLYQSDVDLADFMVNKGSTASDLVAGAGGTPTTTTGPNP